MHIVVITFMNTFIDCFAMSCLISKCFNDKNNYSSLEVYSRERTSSDLIVMTSNNSQSILKERGSITIVVSKLFHINITSFI